MHSIWRGTLIEVGPNDRFCGYGLEVDASPQLVADSALVVLEEGLKAKGLARSVELACPIVVPLDDASATASAATTRKALLSRVAAVKEYFRSFYGTRGSAAVRVAVIDTAAVGYDKYDATPSTGGCAAEACVDRNPHGRAVGRTIATLLCGEGTACPAIKNYLGLPVVSSQTDERDAKRGGAKGTLEDLATAILAAVLDWERIDEPVRPPLVVNLSVGWHAVHNRLRATELRVMSPQQFYSQPVRESDGTALVRAALQRARCAGALVIAAAGNAIGGDRLMPMYPAGWEAEPALTLTECSKRGLRTRDAIDPKPGERGDPLVYAVTAVDDFGSPLGNTRLAPPELYKLPGGMAPRAALGYAVALKDPRSRGGYTQIYSGTSMAAAVFSGLAARAWATTGERSRLAAREIMGRVPKGNCGVYGEADVSKPGYRKVDLCLARHFGEECAPSRYEIAGAPSEPRCPRLPTLPSRKAGVAGPSLPSPCSLTSALGSCSSPRPSRHYLFEPWVHPQPDPTPCGRCSIQLRRTQWLVNWRAAPATALLTQVKIYGRNSPLDVKAIYDLTALGFRRDSEIALEPFDRRAPVEADDAPVEGRDALIEASISMLLSNESGETFETEDLVPLLPDDGT